jgi:dienelactone hydrolase
MHLGEEDEFISKAAQARSRRLLPSNPNATVYSYPGQHHAFARHNGAHYDAAAAALANGRTAEFLHRHLAVTFDRAMRHLDDGRIACTADISRQGATNDR